MRCDRRLRAGHRGLRTAGLLGKAAATAARACASRSLNKLMALGRPHWSALRRELQALLRADAAGAANRRRRRGKHLLPLAETEVFVPAEIGDYSDFYACLYHARNVGSLFRPDDPLPVNYKYIPIGYHGRASSIVISGTQVRRPRGQTREGLSEPIRFGPSRGSITKSSLACSSDRETN